MTNNNPALIQPTSGLQLSKIKPIFEMLAVTMKGGLVKFINEQDIVYCKADGRNTLIYFNNGTDMVVPKLMKQLLAALPAADFYRIHNSYIVNMSYARKFIKKNHGGEIELADGSTLPVSEKKRNDVIGLFKIV